MTTANSSPLQGLTVQVVEDDEALLKTLTRAFREAGCQVMAARDGDEAMAQFRLRAPDAVVTDIIMPNREGLETIMAMKTISPGVPILAISGGGRLRAGEVLGLADRLGADGTLSKPFRPSEVVAALTALIDGRPGDATE